MTHECTPQTCEWPGATGQNATNQNSTSPKFTAKSTSTEAQHDRIIDALWNGPKTSHELRCIGIYQVSTRILELREMGFNIRTARVTLHDRDGYPHPRCALDSLEGDAI